MKRRILKLLILVLIFGFQGIQLTGSYFTDEKKVNGLTFSTGCWAAPSIPQLVYPGNNYNAIQDSDWLANPYMDWENSTSTCPLVNAITYQYESYRDVDLTQLAYRSGWLTDSQIPAPGTPNGIYYWHVRSKDQLGNVSNFSAPWLLTVDRSAPPPESTPPAVSNVVLNEILPNPIGSDWQDGLAGEWIELYNNGDDPIDVSGWYVKDAANHKRTISTTTTNYSQVVLGAEGSGSEWLVLFMNAQVLDNDGDTVTLYTDADVPVDSYTYTGSVSEDKSLARDPDGTGLWHDPIPTPNGPNKLEEGPTVDFSLRNDKHAVSFQVNSIKRFKTISYEITYDAKPEAKQIAGTANLNNEDGFTRENLLLGTCSEIEGKVCVYDWGMTKITLRVVLTPPDGQTTEIIKEIAY